MLLDFDQKNQQFLYPGDGVIRVLTPSEAH
jgi:hypothetical protein